MLDCPLFFEWEVAFVNPLQSRLLGRKILFVLGKKITFDILPDLNNSVQFFLEVITKEYRKDDYWESLLVQLKFYK